MYSVTSAKSFYLIEKFRNKILSLKENQKLPILIIGNKTDSLFGREISKEEAESLAKRIGCFYHELSVQQDELIDVIKPLLTQVKLQNTIQFDGKLGAFVNKSVC